MIIIPERMLYDVITSLLGVFMFVEVLISGWWLIVFGLVLVEYNRVGPSRGHEFTIF